MDPYTITKYIQSGDLEPIQALKGKFDMYTKLRLDGESFLHIAARDGNIDCVKFFVEDCGIDINIKDCNGETPLHYIFRFSNYSSDDQQYKNAEYLIHNGADVNIKGYDDETPLHKACHNNTPKIAKLLLDNGANVSAQTKSKNTPLHISSRFKDIQLLKLLIDYKPYSFYQKNKYGKTPFDFASDEALAYLKEHEPSINIRYNDKQRGEIKNLPQGKRVVLSSRNILMGPGIVMKIDE